MKEYQRQRSIAQRRSFVAGLAATLAFHGAALALVSISGIKYIWPPQEERTFLLDFVEEPLAEAPLENIVKPVSPKPDKTREESVSKKSESPVADPVKNEMAEAARDDFGDVETPSPEPAKPKLDARALFPGMARRDTSSAAAPHSADARKPSFSEGAADGNSTLGPVAERPNARLAGREVVGSLVKPEFSGSQSGVVVVKIYVDPSGVVTNAVPNQPGTTITDAKLWEEARKAALKTRFTQARADENKVIPPKQEGFITYSFILK